MTSITLPRHLYAPMRAGRLNLQCHSFKQNTIIKMLFGNGCRRYSTMTPTTTDALNSTLLTSQQTFDDDNTILMQSIQQQFSSDIESESLRTQYSIYQPELAPCHQLQMTQQRKMSLSSSSLFSLSQPRFFSRINWSLMGRKPQTSLHKFRKHFRRANLYTPHQDKLLKEPLRNEHFLEANKGPSVPAHLKEPKQPAWYDLIKIMNIEEGDLVQILYGRDMGKQGVVRKIHRKKKMVTVQGLNMKKSFRVDTGDRKIGSVMCSVEMPIHVTNVMLVDPVTKKPTRVKRRYTMFGECVRVSKISGSAMPQPVQIKQEDREKFHSMYQKQMNLAKEFRGQIKQLRDKRHYRMLAMAVKGQSMSSSDVTSRSMTSQS